MQIAEFRLPTVQLQQQLIVLSDSTRLDCAFDGQDTAIAITDEVTS